MSTLSSSMVILMRTTSYLMCKLKMGNLSFVIVALMRTAAFWGETTSTRLSAACAAGSMT